MVRCRLLILLVFVIIKGSGQGLFNETTIYIPDSMDVHVIGDVVNTNFIENNGRVFFSGNWSNNFVYQGNGTVILNGPADQQLFNNRQPFESLTIEGQGVKSIRNKLFINSVLTLNQGLVRTTSQDTLWLREQVQIKGGSEGSFVDGPLYNEGNGFKFFPIGKNGKYHPAELSDVKGIHPIVSLEALENYSGTEQIPKVNILHDFYWECKDITGSFQGSPTSLGFSGKEINSDEQFVIVAGDQNNLKAIQNVLVMHRYPVEIISNDDIKAKIFLLGSKIPDPPPPAPFYLSTTLSPNAINPENHYVKVFGEVLKAENFTFHVFNRKGMIVFENNSLESMMTDGWDGREKGNGNYLATGLYPYVMSATDISGNPIQKKGVITIIY